MTLHEAAKRMRTAEALRYAGARMSTVGPRVVVSGKRVPVGRALDRVWERPARDVLAQQRRPAPAATRGASCYRPHAPGEMCDVRCGKRVVRGPRSSAHWSVRGGA